MKMFLKKSSKEIVIWLLIFNALFLAVLAPLDCEKQDYLRSFFFCQPKLYQCLLL